MTVTWTCVPLSVTVQWSLPLVTRWPLASVIVSQPGTTQHCTDVPSSAQVVELSTGLRETSKCPAKKALAESVTYGSQDLSTFNKVLEGSFSGHCETWRWQLCQAVINGPKLHFNTKYNSTRCQLSDTREPHSKYFSSLSPLYGCRAVSEYYSYYKWCSAVQWGVHTAASIATSTWCQLCKWKLLRPTDTISVTPIMYGPGDRSRRTLLYVTSTHFVPMSPVSWCGCVCPAAVLITPDIVQCCDQMLRVRGCWANSITCAATTSCVNNNIKCKHCIGYPFDNRISTIHI